MQTGLYIHITLCVYIQQLMLALCRYFPRSSGRSVAASRRVFRWATSQLRGRAARRGGAGPGEGMMECGVIDPAPTAVASGRVSWRLSTITWSHRRYQPRTSIQLIVGGGCGGGGVGSYRCLACEAAEGGRWDVSRVMTATDQTQYKDLAGLPHTQSGRAAKPCHQRLIV